MFFRGFDANRNIASAYISYIILRRNVCMYAFACVLVCFSFYLLNSSQNVFELPFGWNINNHICVPLIIALDEKQER